MAYNGKLYNIEVNLKDKTYDIKETMDWQSIEEAKDDIEVYVSENTCNEEESKIEEECRDSKWLLTNK